MQKTFDEVWKPIKNTRIDLLIAAIEKSRAVNMCRYRETHNDGGLESLHPCGNRACIAGHMALLPEFRAAGGSVAPDWSGRLFYPYMDESRDTSLITDYYYYGYSNTISGPTAFCYWIFGHINEVEHAICECLIKGYKVSEWAWWDWQDAVKALEILKSWEDFGPRGLTKFRKKLCGIRRPDLFSL